MLPQNYKIQFIHHSAFIKRIRIFPCTDSIMPQILNGGDRILVKILFKCFYSDFILVNDPKAIRFFVGL